MFGVTQQQLAAERRRRDATADETDAIGVAPQLWPAVRLFDALRRTQWQWVHGGRAAQRVGLRYEAMPAVVRMLGLKPAPLLLQRLQVMEAEALRVFSGAEAG